jgi:hypothetical protein
MVGIVGCAFVPPRFPEPVRVAAAPVAASLALLRVLKDRVEERLARER